MKAMLWFWTFPVQSLYNFCLQNVADFCVSVSHTRLCPRILICVLRYLFVSSDTCLCPRMTTYVVFCYNMFHIIGNTKHAFNGVTSRMDCCYLVVPDHCLVVRWLFGGARPFICGFYNITIWWCQTTIYCARPLIGGVIPLFCGIRPLLVVLEHILVVSDHYFLVLDRCSSMHSVMIWYFID